MADSQRMTVGQLMESYGPPPAEICNDWVAQITECESSAESENAPGVEQAVVGPIPLAALQVDSNGILHCDRRSGLRFLDAAALKSIRLEIESIAGQTPDGGYGGSRNAASQSHFRSNRVRRDRSRDASAGRQRSRIISLATVGTLMAIGLAVVTWKPWSGTRSGLASSSTTVPLDPPSATGQATDSSSAAVPVIDGLSQSVDEPEITTSDQLVQLAGADDVAGSREQTTREANLDAFSDLQLDSVASVPSEVRESSRGTAEPDEDRAGDLSADAWSPPTEAEIMSALGEIGRQAEGDVAESEISVPATDATNANDAADSLVSMAPLRLTLEPVLQVQRIPVARVPRTRTPSWSIRIAAADGFEVEPSQAVALQGRAIAEWTVAATDGDHATMQVLVRAQLVGKRGEAIRWRVVAVDQESPQWHVPLGQRPLDLTAAFLKQTEVQLRFGIEQLKATAALDGIPSSARSMLSKRRKAAESQLDWIEQMGTTVARASQLSGWLDGQLDVHALYHDASKTPSTPLLQFGTPEPVEKDSDDGDSDVELDGTGDSGAEPGDAEPGDTDLGNAALEANRGQPNQMTTEDFPTTDSPLAR